MADIVRRKSLRGTDFERRHFDQSPYGSSMLSHSSFANAPVLYHEGYRPTDV